MEGQQIKLGKIDKNNPFNYPKEVSTKSTINAFKKHGFGKFHVKKVKNLLKCFGWYGDRI